ncbi:hypothetical protein HMPREF0497_0472 [Lentilactobacillus buchneri ATCC 11577]|nr:hypothetical protein HMPREF0497_0472 [Lentilactobacillus buchneri ATCC 11577]
MEKLFIRNNDSWVYLKTGFKKASLVKHQTIKCLKKTKKGSVV